MAQSNAHVVVRLQFELGSLDLEKPAVDFIRDLATALGQPESIIGPAFAGVVAAWAGSPLDASQLASHGLHIPELVSRSQSA